MPCTVFMRLGRVSGLDVLVPDMGEDHATLVESVRAGALLKCEITQPRRPKRHKLYWATLRNVVASTALGDTFPTTTHLHKSLLLTLGYHSTVHNLVTGEVFLVPDSTSWARMDETTFSEYLGRAFATLADATGIDPLTLTRGTADATNGGMEA